MIICQESILAPVSFAVICFVIARGIISSSHPAWVGPICFALVLHYLADLSKLNHREVYWIQRLACLRFHLHLLLSWVQISISCAVCDLPQCPLSSVSFSNLSAVTETAHANVSIMIQLVSKWMWVISGDLARIKWDTPGLVSTVLNGQKCVGPHKALPEI